jgi:O-antigen/teichoic acid export membrane protein
MLKKSILSEVFLNTIILFGSGLLFQIVNFVVMLTLARSLGPELFGKLNFSSSLLSYFLMVGTFGLNFFGAKEIARSAPARYGQIIGSIILVRFAASMLSFLLLLIFFFLVRIDNDIYILSWIFSLEIIFSIFLLDWVYQGIGKMGYIGLSKIIAVLSMAIIVFLTRSSLNAIYWAATAQIVGVFLSTFYLILLRKKIKLKLKFLLDRNLCLKGFKEGGVISITMFLNLVMFSSGLLMLGIYRSAYEVGLFSAFYKVCMLIIGFSGAYYNSIYPIASDYYKKSILQLTKLKHISLKLTLFFSLPILMGFITFPSQIKHLLFGNKYIGNDITFGIMGIMLFLNLINTPFGRGLMVTDQHRTLFKIMLLSSTANVIAGFLFIPKVGVLGAGIALVVGELVALPFQYLSFSKYIKTDLIGLLRDLFVPFLFLFLMKYLCFDIFGLNWILSLVLSFFVYVLILIKLDFFMDIQLLAKNNIMASFLKRRSKCLII